VAACSAASSAATTNNVRRAAWVALALSIAALTARAAEPALVHLEQLTWTELRDRVAAGTTVALVPIGGTEQNGPHMTLGKHNVRVRLLAERIARELGNALVAPVVAYVPEGSIEPPSGHMRYPGTVSVPPAAFEATLEATARSLQRAGLTHVVLLGDHGGYRRSLERVAARVKNVHALPAYYEASSDGLERALRAQGFGAAEIGQHAGLADTSLMLAVDPSQVRIDPARTRAPGAADGVVGDPRRADARWAEQSVQDIIRRSVAAIRERVGRPQSGPRP
jgi:creatinine amidohydrolase